MARAADHRSAEGWQTYFGDSLPGLSASETAAFERGYKIFVSPVAGNIDRARNASSCVECHNVPMPGGSAGVAPVGAVSIDLAEPAGELSQIVQRNHKHLHTATLESRRTPALFGIGLIEFADIRNTGRFGTFANKTNLAEFVSSAVAVELGASTPQHCARHINDLAYPEKCTIDVGQDDVDDLVTYLRFLAPPKPHRPDVAGLSVFLDIGCGGCHSRTLRTKADAPAPLRNLTFEPFSDFAQHDLGDGQKVRTAPLWGVSSYGPPYMHDAGSMTIQDAIARHRGEGDEVLNRYKQLSPEERAELMDFLQDL